MDTRLKYKIIWVSILIYTGIVFEYTIKRLNILSDEVKIIKKESFSLKKEMKAIQENLERSKLELSSDLSRLKAKTFTMDHNYSKLNALESAIRIYKEIRIPFFIGSPFMHFKCNEIGKNLVQDDGIGKNKVFSNNDLISLSTLGKIDRGFKFNDINDFINIDNVLKDIKGDTQGTFCFWVKRIENQGGGLISFGDTDTDSYFSIRMGDNGYCYFGFGGSYTDISWYGRSAVFKESEEWIHIAIVQNGEAPSIYKNGERQEIIFTSKEDFTKWFINYPNLDNGRIGCANDNKYGNASFFGGYLDDIRYYNRSLTDEEVYVIYNDGKGTEDGVVVYPMK